MIDESKNVQTTPTRTYCKRNRPLPYSYPKCRTPRHWKLTQHLCTTRPPTTSQVPYRLRYAARLYFCLFSILNNKTEQIRKHNGQLFEQLTILQNIIYIHTYHVTLRNHNRSGTVSNRLLGGLNMFCLTRTPSFCSDSKRLGRVKIS